MSDKICPILSATQEENWPCMKEKCAWYNRKLRICAVVHIAGALAGLSDVTEKVATREGKI